MADFDFSELENSDIMGNIDILLKARKSTKYEMASELKIPRATMQNWSTGSVPSSIKLYKIAKYLGVTMEFLILGHEDDFASPDHQLYKNIQKLTTDNKKLVTELVSKLAKN